MGASRQIQSAQLNKMLAVVMAASAMFGPAYAAADDKIEPDRPDFVDSSKVVGKGRLQIETSGAWDRNTANGTTDRTFTTPTLLRMGLGDTWELRLETEGRTIFRSKDLNTGITTVDEAGYADLALGAKWRLQDGQGNTPSVGIIATMNVNSGTAAFRRNGLRPSVRISVEWELPAELSLGVMPGIAYDKDDTGNRFIAGIFGIVLDKSWTDNFRTFIEFAAPQIARAKNGGSTISVDIGAAYTLSDNWQIDTALQRGLNANTPDLAWTVGLSARF
jgi:hypothetical protein